MDAAISAFLNGIDTSFALSRGPGDAVLAAANGGGEHAVEAAAAGPVIRGHTLRRSRRISAGGSDGGVRGAGGGVGAAGGGAGGTVELLNGMFVRGYAEVVTPPKRAYSKEILEHVRQACMKSKRSGCVTAALVVWRLSSGLDPRFLKADGSPLYTVEEYPDEDDIDEMNAKFYTCGELGGRGRKKDGVAAAVSGAAAGHGDEGDALSGGSAAAVPRLHSLAGDTSAPAHAQSHAHAYHSSAQTRARAREFTHAHTRTCTRGHTHTTTRTGIHARADTHTHTRPHTHDHARDIWFGVSPLTPKFSVC